MNIIDCMNNYLRSKAFFFLMFISLTSLAADMRSVNSIAPSSNPGVTTNTYTFKELSGNDKPITLNSYKLSYTLYLPISKYMNPQKIILHLKVNFSSRLSERTQLDVTLNQNRLRRISLPADVSRELNFDMELPLSQLSKDWQALNFTAYFFENQNVCDPNLWVDVSPESSMTITTVNTPFSATLNQLPDLFINPVVLNPTSPILLLPPQATQQEIFSLLNFASYLGTLANNDKILLNTKIISKLTDEEKNHNLILIGITKHLRLTNIASAIGAVTEISNNQNKDSGLIRLEQSPFNQLYGLLTISGNDVRALNKAIDALVMPEFDQMVTGQVAVINEVKNNKPLKSTSDWYQTSLKALNYKNQTISGLGRHQITYYVPLPNDRVPANSTVKTYLTTPRFRTKDGSQITLLVNGQKQSSINLTQEHSLWKVDIDANSMKPGVNTLDYLVNLHLENEQCTLKDYDEVWATIHDNTELSTLFSDEFPQATLNQLPVPFSSEMSLIVPDELSKKDINNLTHLVFTLGRLMKPNFISFYFFNSSAVTEEYVRNHNIILYGTSRKNPWVKFAFDYLPFRLINDDERSLVLPQKDLVLGEHNATGLLELVSSPWSEANAVFLISGTNASSISQAIELFTQDKTRNELNGNIALINADQSVQVINSKDQHYVSLKNQFLLYLKTWAMNSLFYIKYHPQLFIYLLVFIVPLYIYLRQRKK